ncbi:MAG: hypothetical protein KDE27_03685 [Planctomycetes bacterium]|nr:hypothetical protein [Planctomycetota bacterium]
MRFEVVRTAPSWFRYPLERLRWIWRWRRWRWAEVGSTASYEGGRVTCQPPATGHEWVTVVVREDGQ